MTFRPASDSLHALADILWSERRIVELLLCKLTTARLLLAADEHRFLPVALDEVERVAGALRDAELHRSMATTVVASEWRVQVDDLTLGLLAAEAPEPWREVFEDHAAAFADLAGEIGDTTETNQTLALSGLSRIDELRDLLSRAPGERHLRRRRPHAPDVWTDPPRRGAPRARA